VAEPILDLSGVSRSIDGVDVLCDIDWQVWPHQFWVILGLNGSGKTTLVRIASMWVHPSSGSVTVLGESLGRTDVRRLRARVGFASAAMADLLRHDIGVLDVVMTARNAALEPWWHQYDDEDHQRARAALDQIGCGHLADRRFGALSSGERQRVLLARALSIDPSLILLDEPTAALDLAGREQLITSLEELASTDLTAPIALVTHHVEEIPANFTHALLLRGGRAMASGAVDEVITASNLSECFGIDLCLERQHGRFTARAV
jgi:iron complex transport system ATP-binding protein